MQGKLLINKPGQIPCGLINSAAAATVNNTSNNHLPQQQQQQPQHLNHHHQQQNHNGLTYSVSVNTATNRNLLNNNRNLNDNHKKLDRSISEPEKIILQAPTLNNKYLLQTATVPQQQSHHNRQRQQQQQQQQHATILATNTTNIIMKSSTNSNNSSNSSSSSNNNNLNSNSSTTSSRYKTELCRPFEENGTCKYGDKCQFAHGYHELRNLQRHPRYKTVLCRTFHTVGFCPYGPRCHFIHNSEETKKSIIHTLQTGGPNVISVEKMTADHSTPSSSPTSSMLDNLSPSTPTTLLMGASAILNGAFVNNNATTAIGFIANLQQQAQKQLQNGNSATATGMRPKALSIGSSSLDGSSTSGDLSQPSTPPSGSPASLSSCFDQVPNPFDDSIINNLINSSNNTNSNDIQANGDHSAFTFRDTLSLCEQKFLSLSLSPLINY